MFYIGFVYPKSGEIIVLTAQGGMELSLSNHDIRYRRFIERLGRARKEAGLTQVQVGKALGKTQNWVSRCETGEHRVDAVELEEFARAYGKSLSYFLEEV